jgi:hypothetical protein
MDLGALRILNDCPKGHKVIGIYDGDFCMAEVHIPEDTKLSDIDKAVRKVLSEQL